MTYCCPSVLLLTMWSCQAESLQVHSHHVSNVTHIKLLGVPQMGGQLLVLGMGTQPNSKMMWSMQSRSINWILQCKCSPTIKAVKVREVASMQQWVHTEERACPNTATNYSACSSTSRSAVGCYFVCYMTSSIFLSQFPGAIHFSFYLVWWLLSAYFYPVWLRCTPI